MGWDGVERWTGITDPMLIRLGAPVWIPDDGKPGLAFSAFHNKYPMSLYGCDNCGWDCPVYKAVRDRTMLHGQCSNGRKFSDLDLYRGRK